MWRQARLREVCGDHKIHVSAYSPLGGPGNSWGSTAVVDNPIIQSIALKREATPAQVHYTTLPISKKMDLNITKVLFDVYVS